MVNVDQSAYNDLKSVRSPSSLGSWPDNALIPTVLTWSKINFKTLPNKYGCGSS